MKLAEIEVGREYAIADPNSSWQKDNPDRARVLEVGVHGRVWSGFHAHTSERADYVKIEKLETRTGKPRKRMGPDERVPARQVWMPWEEWEEIRAERDARRASAHQRTEDARESFTALVARLPLSPEQRANVRARGFDFELVLNRRALEALLREGGW